jgi:hypothetical protein
VLTALRRRGRRSVRPMRRRAEGAMEDKMLAFGRLKKCASNWVI